MIIVPLKRFQQTRFKQISEVFLSYYLPRKRWQPLFELMKIQLCWKVNKN